MKIRILGVVLSLLMALSMSATKVKITGNINKGTLQTVDLYVAMSGENPAPVNMSDGGKTYSVEVDATAPMFYYMIGVITDSSSNRTQIYAPIYVNPSNLTIHIDVVNDGAETRFVSSDSDQSILTNYYQDFLNKRFTKLPQYGREAPFFNMITNYADSVAEIAKNEVVADYLRLRGYLDRVSATTQLKKIYERRGVVFPKDAEFTIMSIKDVEQNKALPHLLSETAPIVALNIATGGNVVDCIARVKTEVKNQALRNAIEDIIVKQFMSQYNYENGIENGLDTLKMIASSRPDYAQLEYAFKMSSYSAVGAPLPDVAIHDVAGNVHKLSEFKGKYIVIDFWASWCAPCNREIPFLKELEKTLGVDNVVFVGLSVDEDTEAWKNALVRHGLNHNQFIAPEEISMMLNVQSIPRYVIYDKNGKLLHLNAPRPSQGDELRQLLLQLK